MRTSSSLHRRVASVGVILAGSATLVASAIALGSPGLVRPASSAAVDAPNVPALEAGPLRAGNTPAADIRYGRDVRPILADRCFLCHGPDSATRAAGLRLDLRDDAVALRGPEANAPAAIVPGNPDASLVWQRITAGHDDGGAHGDDPMPPADSGKRRLSGDELEIIRAWIEGGAQYEEHWAFIPPTRSPIPTVAHTDWVRNPIDPFILAGLEAKGLAPSPAATPEVLLRRVFLDLTGLPPTPEELDEFLRDARPDAYERWVDRLLTQEPYLTRHAERLASWWLDQARYADTSGIHMDAGRSIWLWRDWVLGASRRNMPFDQFVIDQLAGDLIPGGTVDQVIATGFNRNHVTTDEGGAIDQEYLVEYAVDRVSTTGSVFLGLTLGCARCHDHKYDPVGMDEFYGLYAFFNSIEEPGLYSQVPDAKRALEPFISVPTPEQARGLAAIEARIAEAQGEINAHTPEEIAGRDAFVSGTPARLAFEWERTAIQGAASSGGTTLTPQDDASVLASGTNPATDTHTLTLTFEGQNRNLILLEALTDPSLPHARVGRNGNGNAVLTHINARAESIANPDAPPQDITLIWAWASIEQPDGDFAVVNALDGDNDADRNGWAVDAHRIEGNRVAMFLSDTPFGFEGGTRLTVDLEYASIYPHHSFGRVRVSVGSAPDAALAALPVALGSWHVAGPFGVAQRSDAFALEFGPERDGTIDPALTFPDAGGLAPGAEPANLSWAYAPSIKDGVPSNLDGRLGATYVGRRVYAPSPRSMSMSLGSDDGLRVYLNTHQVLAREVDRGVAPDQDRVDGAPLRAGLNALVLKVANTGGVAGVYFRANDPAIDSGSEPGTPPSAPEILAGIMVGATLPDWARPPAIDAQIGQAWLESYSPRRRVLAAQITQAERERESLRAQVPVTMVMKERPEPVPTYVLTRGQYDAPDPARPVARSVPLALGTLDAPAPSEGSLERARPLNRLDLAKWMMSDDNPLVARVTVNRLWARFFGQGLVRTTEDLGLQGDWPSHPELLDSLAVRFREEGWDTREMIRLIVTSATYRQSSRVRPDALALDPTNRLLSFFPRQRLSAEQIRDQALFVSGLLVERLGGPSVKPYQPAGIWEEVAMPQSNTRVYERGSGEDLYRRSLYTYWKRASPPPAMLAFDAPTRESCVVMRTTTSTPLQALALWNDEQLVEASRALAARTLLEHHLDPTIDDAARLAGLYRRVTGHPPDARTLSALSAALTDFRARYTDAPADAAKLLDAGDSMPPAELDPAELASWTMIASAILSSDAAITRD